MTDTALPPPETALAREDPRFAELRAIVEEHSLLRGDFTLASGRKSAFLFQMRSTLMLPRGQFLIGTLVVDFMKRVGLRSVGGLEMGAVPLVTAAAFASHLADYPVDAFFVRKEAKTHGAKELVNGFLRDGADVLFVDDVTTTGGSTLKAIDKVRLEEDRPITVRYALSVLDREEGATEAMAERGIRLVSLLKKSDFGL